MTAAVDHPNRRLSIGLPVGYDQARTRYEALVPAIDTAAFAAAADWQEVEAEAKTQAPHGFLRYYQIDATPLMVGSGATRQATEYLMGNHTIAARMYRHDPAILLHAPLRTLLYDGPQGAVLAVDQPSLLFDSYGDPAIAEVGRKLDALLAALIGLLGGDIPATLQEVSSP